MTQRVAIVTGANRGLGLEACRKLAQQDYHVVLTSRDMGKGQAAAQQLAQENLEVEAAQLDVSSDQSVADFFQQFKQRHNRLDVLINNAGKIFEQNSDGGLNTIDPMNTPTALVAEAFNTNSLGAMRMLQHAIPMMNAAGYGRIVNVTSGMGGLAEMGGGYPAYRISKVSLNALTRLFQPELKGNVKLNSVCPGWVRTDMGGPQATRDLEEGVYGIIWAATLPDDGPTGGFFRDGEPLSW